MHLFLKYIVDVRRKENSKMIRGCSIHQVLFLLLIIWAIPLNGVNNLSPGGKPMLFVGVYQEGLSGSSYCQSAIRKSDERKEEFWKFMMEKGNFKIDNLMTFDDFTYTEKTFTNVDQLINIIIDLKLNQTYFVNNELEQDPTWNKKKIKSWSHTSIIMIMFLYADKQKSQIVRKLLYGEDYVVLLLNQNNVESIEDGNIHSTNDFLETNAKKLMSQIALQITQKEARPSYGIKYFIVVDIKGANLIYKMEFEYFYNNYVMKYYKELKRCHILYRLNISDEADISNLVHHLVNDQFLNFVIVFGDPQDQAKLYFHYFAYVNQRQIPTSTWIFHDLNKDYFVSHSFYPSHRIYSFNTQNYKFLSQTFFNSLLDSIKGDFNLTINLNLHETAIVKTCSNAYKNQILRMLKIIHLYHKFDLFKGKNLKEYKIHCMNRIKNQNEDNRYMIRIFSSTNKITEDPVTSLTGLNGLKCPIPYCGAGKEKYFGEITDNVFLWNNSFGWTCKLCAVGHFKTFDSPDNSTCVRCPTLMITTKDQSECFDPYINIFLGFNDIIGVIALGISGSGSIFSIFNLMVLYKFRDTPFVKAFDLPKLVQHLLFMLLSFGFYPYLFIGRPSPVKCFLQPISILILSICPSIIILLKSQNVLLLFKSKLRLSKGTKMRSTAWQAMIASVIIVTDASLLYLLMREGLPNVIKTYNHVLYTRNIHCNNGGDINIQITYLIALQLLTSVQAFRGRNLPGPFNEGLAIAFSTFVLVITETVQFPMYYLQQDVKVKSSVHAVVLSASHLLFMFIYYGNKLNLVLCNRKRNTREYFRAQLMDNSRQKVASKLPSKSY